MKLFSDHSSTTFMISCRTIGELEFYYTNYLATLVYVNAEIF